MLIYQWPLGILNSGKNKSCLELDCESFEEKNGTNGNGTKFIISTTATKCWPGVKITAA